MVALTTNMTVGQEHAIEVEMRLENQLGVIEGIMMKIDCVLPLLLLFLFVLLFVYD